MTQDPERLLSATSEADSLEREVLTNLRHAQAPAQARAAAWEGVAAGIAAAALPVTGAAAVVASAPPAGAKAALGLSVKAALGTVTKVAVFAVLGGAALGGSAFLANRQGTWKAAQRATPSRVPLARRASVPSAPIATQVETDLRPAPSATTAMHGAKPAAAARATSKPKSNELLAEESALLGTARAQLRTGDLEAADASLKRLRARFPHGALVQEREVLEIEVLVARGDGAAAKRAAQAFVASHPNSPHSTKLRSRLVEP